MSTATHPAASDELMTEFRTLFAEREHRLAARMLTTDLTPASAEAACRHLRTRPLKPGYVPAGFFPGPAAPSQEAPMAPQPAPASGRIPPAERVTEEGVYRHGGDFYQVLRNVHGSGFLFARRLCLAKDARGGRLEGSFKYVKGMMSQLRAAEKITEAELAEFEAEYGPLHVPCSACGIPLTNITSRALGIGPVCRTK